MRNPAMNVSLSPELERLVREKVDSGLYPTEGDVIEEALRLLENRDRLRAIRREELREEMAVGIEQTDRGEVAPLDADAIRAEARDRPEGREFAALPFFGMAADRDEFADSEAWVRRSREAWQQRASRTD
jgi:antitoxin ParD1/3/4